MTLRPLRWCGVSYEHPDVVALLALMSAELNVLSGRLVCEAPPGAPVEPGGVAVTVLGASEGVPVATASLRPVGDDMELKRMYVAADARGERVGALLLERMESEAERLNARRLVLHTGESQVAAVGLYRSRGYEPIEPLPGYEAAPGSLFLGRSLA